MPGWDSYRAVYGAEVRAAAREFLDHGWPVVEKSADTLMLITGSALDVLEVPAAIGRGSARSCGRPTSSSPWPRPPPARGGTRSPPPALPAGLREAKDVVLHAGDAIAAPPSQVPDGWVHWRVPPAACDFGVAAADLIFSAAATAVALRVDDDRHPGAQRPAGVVAVGMRS